MRVAVVGSRKFKSRELVDNVLWDELKGGDEVWSGGAKGPDTWGEVHAEAREMTVVSFRPMRSAEGLVIVIMRFDGYKWEMVPTDGVYPTFVRAAFARNVRIAHGCERMIAFWDGSSHGTEHVMRKAMDQGKDVRVVYA